ncbi:methyltransferase domain-containing protein [Candidatus Saccharibacteria bacterium]|nr:methyltransferase domain-containing protein [Candidatus Saccharibacteria bacterium]
MHSGLNRQTPGSDATTLHLLHLAGNPKGRGLDIGCGQGRASLLLAKSGIQLTAIDTHQPYLDELNKKPLRWGWAISSLQGTFLWINLITQTKVLASYGMRVLHTS